MDMNLYSWFLIQPLSNNMHKGRFGGTIFKQFFFQGKELEFYLRKIKSKKGK